MSARVVETHSSQLFFVDDRVYKRKKPLDLGFSDFRDVDVRRAACAEEVRLNRRLCPDVYLGVADVLDVDGAVCDHLVVMRRLPDARRLGRLVGGPEDLRPALADLAAQLAGLHARSPARPDLRWVGTPAHLRRLWDEGLDALGGNDAVVPLEVRRRTRELAHRWLAGRAPLLTERIDQGRLYDGHGDLLADDVFLLPDGARILDCLEFDERLRVGDGLADAAFLAMELERLDAPGLARAFLDDYERETADDAPASLEDFYLAYRAHVRSKVTCVRAAQADEPHLHGLARRLADLAVAHLERGRVRLVLVGGLPGSGKTTVATRLADVSGWALLSSDVARKRLAGLPPTGGHPVAFGTGLYTAEMTARTYADLLARARALLEHGTSVVLDASWSDAAARTAARQLARATATDLVELRCVCDQARAEARLVDRPPSASDATPALRRDLARVAAPWPEAVDVDTSWPPALTHRTVESLVGLAPAPHLATLALTPPRAGSKDDADADLGPWTAPAHLRTVQV